MTYVPRHVLSFAGEFHLVAFRTGFLRAVSLVLRVRESGLVAGGPPCGSWAWVNFPTNRRTRDNIWGDTQREYVRKNNVPLVCTQQKRHENDLIYIYTAF